MLLIYRQKES